MGVDAESPEIIKSGMTADALRKTNKIRIAALMRWGWYSRDTLRSFKNRPVRIARANMNNAAEAKRTVSCNDMELPVPEMILDNAYSSIAET
ncbi:MAG TPA: hypothetical protein PKK43_15605 [Spirochaetota bacterium]|nr:hypothetical protein [Spirochaetota bacterium]